MRAENRGTESARRLTLIDTSAWILALRKGDSLRAKDEVDRQVLENRAATSGIIMLELLSGTRTKREYQELKEDLGALIQLETPAKIWERASHLAYALRRKGITVPSTDILIITAIAMENGCILLHADRHFDLIAEQELALTPSDVRSLLQEETVDSQESGVEKR